MEIPRLPLTRRLGPLEVLDAAIWFARDNLAAWLCTAAAGSLGFALALVGYVSACTGLREARDGTRDVVVYGGAAVLAALFVGRALGQWAALEFLRADVHGERRTPEGCWLPALRRAPVALGIGGWCAAAHWGGSLLALWPGLAHLNRSALALPAAVFEALPLPRAFRRSRELMGGSVSALGVWGFLLLAWAALFANALIFGGFFPGFARSFLGLSFPRVEQAIAPGNSTWVLLAAAGTWALCDAVKTVAFGILYMNARIEREGSDLLTRLAELEKAEGRAEVAHA